MIDNVQTDVILDFKESIANMEKFGQEMETLDSRFGTLEHRVDALRSSLSMFSAQVTKGTGSNLRQQIQNELNSIVASNGVVLNSVGNGKFTVKKDTVKGLLDDIQSKLNQEMATMVRNMNIEIDPNYTKGQKIPIGKTEFDEINKEVARVIKVQVANLVQALKKHGAGLISANDLKDVELSIGKTSIQTIVNKIRDEIMKKIVDPNVNVEGVEFKLTKTDMQKMVTKVKNQLKTAFDVDVADIKKLDNKDVYNKVRAIPDKIDSEVKGYVNSMVKGVQGAMAGRMEIPVKDLEKRLKGYIAKELDTTVDKLDQSLKTIDLESVSAYETKRQMERLIKAMDKQLNKGVTDSVTSLIKSIEEIKPDYSPKLKRHLIDQINRVNNKIVEKMKEQIDVQFAAMRMEVDSVQARAKPLNSAGKLRGTAGTQGGRPRAVGNESAISVPRQPRQPISGGDAYARRDNYFNSFGLMGAITNTVRHIVAGSIAGAPIMAMMSAVDSFKAVGQQQIIMYQNMMLKSDYKVTDPKTGQPTNEINHDKISSSMKELDGFLQKQAVYFGKDFKDIYEAAGVASRLGANNAEVKMYVDQANKLTTVDGTVTTTQAAEGLEAIKGQFGLAAGELEEKVTKPLVAATTITNISMKDALEAMKRSGSSFNSANTSPGEGILLNSETYQATGLAGANGGNFYKSITSKMQTDGALKAFSDMELSPYTTDPKTGAQTLKSLGTILTELQGALKNNGKEKDDAYKNEIYSKLFGTWQGGKGQATLQVMDKFQSDLKKMNDFNQKQFEEMMQYSLSHPKVQLDRTVTSSQIAFEKVMEAAAPQLNNLLVSIQGITQGITTHADLIAKSGGIISQALLGLMMWQGIKFGYGKVKDDVKGNYDVFAERTNYMDKKNSFDDEHHLDYRPLKEYRAEAKMMQSNPVLSSYLKEFNQMSKEQMSHFNDYVKHTQQTPHDLASFFTLMQEAKQWTKPQLTPEQHYDKSSVYTNSLSTNRNLQGILEPSFMGSYQRLHATPTGFVNANAPGGAAGFESASTRMAGMSQSEFDGFTQHLTRMQAEGAPTIQSIEGLNAALDSYKQHLNVVAQEARQTSTTFTTVNDAIRSTTSEMSRAASATDRFKGALQKIPDIAKGVGASMVGLSKNIASLVMQVTAMLGLAQAAQSIAFNATATNEQKDISHADATDKKVITAANMAQQQSLNGSHIGRFVSSAYMKYYGVMNGIDKMFGGKGDAGLSGSDYDKMTEMVRQNVNKKYKTNITTQQGLAYWLDTNGKNFQEEFSDAAKQSGLTGNNQKVRAAASKKQEEAASLSKKELDDLKKDANTTAAKRDANKNAPKEHDTLAGDDANKKAQEASQRLNDALSTIKSQNTIQTLQSLLGGMSTDSEQYISMRKRQVDQMKAVLAEELKVYDEHIAVLQAAVDNAKDPASKKSAQDKLDEARKQKDKAVGAAQADVLQEEWTVRQEAFQKRMGRVNKKVQEVESTSQKQETMAGVNMDRQSESYFNEMISISKKRMADLQGQLANMRKIAASGDMTSDKAQAMRSLENTIASEQLKQKELSMSKGDSYKRDLQDHASERDNNYLSEKLRRGGADDDTPAMRVLRMRMAKQEVSDINSVIAKLRGDMQGKGVEEQKKIQADIRDLTKQSLQAQISMLQEMKNGAGTFNVPDGVRTTTYYEYLTRNMSHKNISVGGGDVNVNLTLPNITNGMTTAQVKQLMLAVGSGIYTGRTGGMRNQMAMNVAPYRGRYS